MLLTQPGGNSFNLIQGSNVLVEAMVEVLGSRVGVLTLKIDEMLLTKLEKNSFDLFTEKLDKILATKLEGDSLDHFAQNLDEMMLTKLDTDSFTARNTEIDEMLATKLEADSLMPIHVELAKLRVDRDTLGQVQAELVTKLSICR